MKLSKFKKPKCFKPELGSSLGKRLLLILHSQVDAPNFKYVSEWTPNESSIEVNKINGDYKRCYLICNENEEEIWKYRLYIGMFELLRQHFEQLHKKADGAEKTMIAISHEINKLFGDNSLVKEGEPKAKYKKGDLVRIINKNIPSHSTYEAIVNGFHISKVDYKTIIYSIFIDRNLMDYWVNEKEIEFILEVEDITIPELSGERKDLISQWSDSNMIGENNGT